MAGRSEQEHGEGNEGERGEDEFESPYIIDETVELEKYGQYHGYVWEIEEDIDPTSKYILRGISRDSSSHIQFLILPEEEAEAFKDGENYWPEWESAEGDKLRPTVTVNTEDEDPYYHSGDLKLAVRKTRGTGSPRITVKFREADDE